MLISILVVCFVSMLDMACPEHLKQQFMNALCFTFGHSVIIGSFWCAYVMAQITDYKCKCTWENNLALILGTLSTTLLAIAVLAAYLHS